MRTSTSRWSLWSERVLPAFAVGGLLLAACGGSGKSNGTLTFSEIASATKDATTLRFATEVRLHVDEGSAGFPYTGEWDGEAASFTMTGGGGQQDMIWADDRTYRRTSAPDPKFSHDWCENKDTEWRRESAVEVSPLDTLSNLEAAGNELRRIGRQQVRGVETDHYTIEDADPPIELWVDEDDRLRRHVWTHGEPPQTDTVEYFDYGAPIEITVPRDAPSCPEIPPGFEGRCILGKSYDELPKCRDHADGALGFIDVNQG